MERSTRCFSVDDACPRRREIAQRGGRALQRAREVWIRAREVWIRAREVCKR